MLKVGVVQQFFLALGGKAGVGKLLRDAHERRHQRRGAAAVLGILCRGAQQAVAAQAFDLLFGAVTQLAGRKGRRVAGLAALDAPRFAPGAAQFVQQGDGVVPPALRQRLAQRFDAGGVVQQHRRVGGVGGFVPRGGARAGFQQGFGPAGARVRNAQHFAPPGGILRGGFGLPLGGKPLQGLRRVRQRAAEVVEFQHGAAGGLVGAAAVVQIGKSAEIGVRIGSFQHVGQRLLLDAGQIRLLGHLEIRRDVQRGKVLLHKMQAEGVHRANGRALQQQLLAAQAHIAGAGAHLLRQAGRDVGPQLGGGRVGKGHDEQLVGVHGVVGVGDEARDALDQDAGLAGTGGRRHQQAAAPRADGGSLRGGELDFGGFRHSVLLFYSSANGSLTLGTVRSSSPSWWGQAMRKSQ